jgi:diadenosine tetraphosphate (Ap4A) HIT family hydrolase
VSVGVRDELRVFEDEHFTADQCETCAVPGYLILRLKGPATSLAGLDPAAAGRLGEMLARAAQAIEEATSAERVYCLAFAEIDTRLHFHLFPRTRAVLEAYWRATGSEGEPVNGPRLFEWARTAIVPGRPVPAGLPDMDDVCAALRRTLRR